MNELPGWFVRPAEVWEVLGQIIFFTPTHQTVARIQVLLTRLILINNEFVEGSLTYSRNSAPVLWKRLIFLHLCLFHRKEVEERGTLTNLEKQWIWRCPLAVMGTWSSRYNSACFPFLKWSSSPFQHNDLYTCASVTTGIFFKSSITFFWAEFQIQAMSYPSREGVFHLKQRP